MLGDVVIGKRPWNKKYNVGLIIEESDDITKVRNHDTITTDKKGNISSYKVLWTNPKRERDKWETIFVGDLLNTPEVCYTWEVETSFECISGATPSGRS